MPLPNFPIHINVRYAPHSTPFEIGDAFEVRAETEIEGVSLFQVVRVARQMDVFGIEARDDGYAVYLKDADLFKAIVMELRSGLLRAIEQQMETRVYLEN